MGTARDGPTPVDSDTLRTIALHRNAMTTQVRSIVRTCVANGQVPLRTRGEAVTCGFVSMFEPNSI